MAREEYDVLISSLVSESSRVQENYSAMLEFCSDLKKHLQASVSEGSEKYTSRHEARGKLLARDRVDLLLDIGSPFLELMPLAGFEQEDMTLGGSIVAGLGVVGGVLCLINANVPTIKGGAFNEVSVIKATRLDEIALENRLPVIYLTESAGADLPQQAKIFNFGGKAFREITRRSSLGIPSISIVFGSSTAGGAYIPGMSDYTIMVQKQAKTYLAGPPLVKMAINEECDDETLGGADMHALRSGLCDFLAENERAALKKARQVVNTFNYKALGEASFEAPLYPAEDLLKIISADVRKPFEVREV